MGKGHTIVLDNGAGTFKVGFAGHKNPVKVMPNYVAKAKGVKKPFVADQIDSCDDIQALTMRRPFDRGYVVNWDLQKEIWDRAFTAVLKVKPSECKLMITEPLFNLPNIQTSMDSVIFEDYGFQAFCCAPAPLLSHQYQAERDPASILGASGCGLVVDAGFSFTHAAPVCAGAVLRAGVRRMNLGGKALTNYLKELVSYRAWNMMEETFLMEDVKERLCFASLDVRSDLTVARKSGSANYLRCEYVLPDGVRHRRGFVKSPAIANAYLAKRRKLMEEMEEEEDEGLARIGGGPRREGGAREDEISAEATTSGRGAETAKRKDAGTADDQELTLTNERFMVPEMLFHPIDLGVNQAGLAECIVRSVSACPPELQPLLYSSVLLTGGSTLFPGFKERLETELRPLVPDEYTVRIFAPDNPVLCAWRGASIFAASPDFESFTVTKKQYEEEGSARCRRRFEF